MEEYIYKNHKKLRYGYTTGSCAAAASKAAAAMLLSGKEISDVELMTPKALPFGWKCWKSIARKHLSPARSGRMVGMTRM